jgi:hypothetical protein
LNELSEQTRELESKHSQVLSERDEKISVLDRRIKELDSQLRLELEKVKALLKERDSLRLLVQENAVAIDSARIKIACAATREVELQEKIDRLTERIESERFESERIKQQDENQLDELTREHNRVLDESSKRFAAIKELLDESELKRKTEIADLESEIALLRDRRVAEIEASDERIAELEFELARQGAEREHWRDRSARFERERDEHAARIADTDKRFNETLFKHASEIDSLRKQIEVERDAASSARLRVEELTSARTADERRIEEAVGELRLAERRVEELTSARTNDEHRIEELTSLLFEAERTVKELTQSSTVSELRVRQATNNLRSAEHRVQELSSANSEAEKTIARLIEAGTISDRARIESAEKIAELSRRLERATSDRESEIENLERMIDSKNAEIDRLIAESSAAIDEKRASEREFETLKQVVAETLKDKEKYENMTVLLKQELDQTVSCWNEARSADERKIGELESRVESAESSCAVLTSEVERTRIEIERLEGDSSLARAELERSRIEIERLERDSSLARAEADEAHGLLSAELDRARREVADERRRAVVGAAEREALLDRIRKLESQSLERIDDSSESLQLAVADLAIVDKTSPDFEVERPAPDRSASIVDSLDATSASKFIDVLAQHLRIAQTLNKHLRTLYEERRYQGARGETLDARARSEELASSARSAREQIERDWLDWLRIYQAKAPRRAATRPVESGQIRRRIEVLSHQILSVQNTNDRLRSLFQESDVAATTPSGRLEIASGAITIEVDSVATKI